VTRFGLVGYGAIGTPVSAAIHLSRFPYRLGSSGWRYDRSRVASWTLEEPVHYFDLVRWYLETHGPPQSIYAGANSVKPAELFELETEIQAMAAAVSSGATAVPSPLVDAEAGAWAVRLCLAAEDSARTGQIVPFG
jgi:myo-inositol 2-dehydrogenase/D-chiro-inositol 1-dehydrogenase